MRYFLFFIFIPAVFLIHAGAYAQTPEIPATERFGLPPLHILGDKKTNIVLTPEQAALTKYGSSWSILPRLTIARPETDNQPKVVIINLTGAENLRQDSSPSAIYSTAFALAKELSTPLYKHFVTDNESATEPYLYVDISSVLLSYMIRQATDDKIDVMLLSSKNEDKYMFINGVEIGVRPHSLFGVRLRLREGELKSDYGIELGLYPTESTSLKLMRDDNDTEKRTGVKFNLNF